MSCCFICWFNKAFMSNFSFNLNPSLHWVRVRVRLWQNLHCTDTDSVAISELMPPAWYFPWIGIFHWIKSKVLLSCTFQTQALFSFSVPVGMYIRNIKIKLTDWVTMSLLEHYFAILFSKNDPEIEPVVLHTMNPVMEGLGGYAY